MERFKLLPIFLLAITIIVSLVGCAQENQREITAAEFYKGKNLELITTGSPGSDDDLLAEIISSGLARETGSTIKTINKRGAGGMDGVNYIFKDTSGGLAIGFASVTKLIGNGMMREPTAEYEIEKLSYIFSLGSERVCFFISPESPINSIADLQQATDLKVGGSSPSGTVTLGGLSVIKLLGLDAKVVSGFASESDRALAVKRNEITGYCLTMSTVRTSMEAGLVKPFFVLADHRDPLLPEVPAITELITVNAEDQRIMDFWNREFISSRVLIASPEIPADRLGFLCEAAIKLSQDENFRKESNKIVGYEVEKYYNGEELKQNILEMSGDFDKLYTIFSELIEKYRL
jgi:tripartite-type tricarboxylate transporter receptor subunit TctC